VTPINTIGIVRAGLADAKAHVSNHPCRFPFNWMARCKSDGSVIRRSATLAIRPNECLLNDH
jgi:hypothetical protein